MEIKVFLHNSKTPVFARIIQTNNAIDLDYSCLLRALKIMFGNDILIQLNIV